MATVDWVTGEIIEESVEYKEQVKNNKLRMEGQPQIPKPFPTISS